MTACVCTLQWALMTLLDPAKSLANMLYIGFSGDIASAFCITRRRRLDRRRQESQRNVFQCYVFGPRSSGKSALLNSFTGRCCISVNCYLAILLTEVGWAFCRSHCDLTALNLSFRTILFSQWSLNIFQDSEKA